MDPNAEIDILGEMYAPVDENFVNMHEEMLLERNAQKQERQIFNLNARSKAARIERNFERLKGSNAVPHHEWEGVEMAGIGYMNTLYDEFSRINGSRISFEKLQKYKAKIFPVISQARAYKETAYLYAHGHAMGANQVV